MKPRKQTLILFAKHQATQLGQVIYGSRKQQGMTQAQLADALDVSIPTVRKLEGGDTAVSFYTGIAALLVLGIEKDVLKTQVKPDLQTLPHIETTQKASFAKRLITRGIAANDAENTAWILSRTPQQRFQMLINLEKERHLCGIARP